jgi:hypothetical protein
VRDIELLGGAGPATEIFSIHPKIPSHRSRNQMLEVPLVITLDYEPFCKVSLSDSGNYLNPLI